MVWNKDLSIALIVLHDNFDIMMLFSKLTQQNVITNHKNKTLILIQNDLTSKVFTIIPVSTKHAL